MNRRRYLAVATGLLGGVAGCARLRGDGGAGRPTVGTTVSGGTARFPGPGGALGYTHARPSGNRVVSPGVTDLVSGAGRMPDVSPVDVPLSSDPAWIAAAPDVTADGPSARAGIWVAVADDGSVEGIRIAPGEDGPSHERVDVSPGTIPEGTPPLLAVTAEERWLVVPPAGASSLTHPVPAAGARVHVGGDGDLVVVGEGGEVRDRFGVDALPDARLAVAGERVVALTGATDRYDHGAVGDAVEAGSVTVLDAAGPAVETTIDLPGEAVVEGVGPLLADWGPGADPGVVLTETDADRGARIVCYSLDGERLAAGPAVGRGYRWRHQLCLAPFAGGRELAVVKTPHIGGTAEFYRREGDRLRIAARVDGYSSHAYGSRNLDGALAGDIDGDGRPELLIPTDDRRRLAGIRRVSDGAKEVWRVDAGGTVTANLAAAPLGDRVAVGVGRSGGLRVW